MTRREEEPCPGRGGTLGHCDEHEFCCYCETDTLAPPCVVREEFDHRVKEWLNNAQGDARIIRGEDPVPLGVSMEDVRGTFGVNLTCLRNSGHKAEADLIESSVPAPLSWDGFPLGEP